MNEEVKIKMAEGMELMLIDCSDDVMGEFSDK